MRLSAAFFLLSSTLAFAGERPPLEVHYFQFPSAETAAALHDQVRSLLEQTGWWDFVVRHVDRIEYHNRRALSTKAGKPVLGRAWVRGSRRIMAVSVQEWPPTEIARVMVHEAGHLEHFDRYGQFDDESWAEYRETEFLSQGRGPTAGEPFRAPKIDSEKFLNLLILCGAVLWLIAFLMDKLGV